MSDHQTTVRSPDALVAEERGAVSALLEANAERREAAEAELRAAREGLQELLLRGHAAGMQVADMARRAQISRDTAHRALTATLRETGQMTWKEKQAWASEVMAHIPGGDHERNEFRMFMNMLLLKALGKNHEGLPQSVKGLLDEATRDMKTIAGKPNFKPEYDPVILTLDWPGASGPRTAGRERRRRASTSDAARETLPGRERRVGGTSNNGGNMKARTWKLAALAAVLAVVFVPIASARSGARPRLSVLPLPASAIGSAAKSLSLQQDSGVLSSGGASTSPYVGAGVPVSPNRSLLPMGPVFAKLGRVSGYALDYGLGASGSAGVTEIRTGVDQYKTSADAKKGLAFWKLADRGIARCGGGGLSIGLRKQKVAAVGGSRFSFLVGYRDANTSPLYGVDEQFTEGRYEADVSVWAGTAAAAKQLAPKLATTLDKRIDRTLAGRLHATPVTLPVRRRPGPPPGGPDLASLALKATDLSGSATLGLHSYWLDPFLLAAPVLSDYQLSIFPAGQFSSLAQEIGWYQTANEASFVADFEVAHFGEYSLDLSSLGDGARGALVNRSGGGFAAVVFSSGRLAESIQVFDDSGSIKASQFDSVAQTAATYINSAGLGS